MRKTLIVLLVVLVVLLAVPALGMAAALMAPCPDCDLSTGAGGWGMCLAVLLLLSLAAPLATTSLHRRSARFRPLLLPIFVDRPPRFS